MKFKVDKNLPVELAELLQQAGHEAATVYDQNLVGENDLNLALICQAEQRTLITLDTDFTDIRSYPPNQYSGIIVMRLKQQDKGTLLEIVSRLIKAFTTEKLTGYLWIVDEQRIRVRS
jgi:predicted nuclease of predicted toxin-antitoxin system